MHLLGRICWVLPLSFVLLLGACAAHAWSDVGHGAVGEIAERNLTPKAQTFVREILGIEPLAAAAVWPDQVRMDERFKRFAPFHILTIPPGMSYDTLPADERVEHDGYTILSQVPTLLLKPDLSRTRKMLLLRFLAHVAGDMHQPMHVGNGIDMGGNLCEAKWTDPNTNQQRIVNMHTAWDEQLIEHIKVDFFNKTGADPKRKRGFTYREMANIVLAEYGAGRASVKTAAIMRTPVTKWFAESAALHAHVYPDSTPGLRPEDRVYCRQVNREGAVIDGRYDASRLPTLSDEYIKRANATIKRQIAVAGVRLAQLLNDTAQRASVKAFVSADDTRVLESVMLKNTLERAPQNQNQNAKMRVRREVPHED